MRRFHTKTTTSETAVGRAIVPSLGRHCALVSQMILTRESRIIPDDEQDIPLAVEKR